MLEELPPVIPHQIYLPLEVAKRLRVGKSHLYALIAKGELRVIRVGKCIRIRGSDITAYEDSRADGGPTPSMNYKYLNYP